MDFLTSLLGAGSCATGLGVVVSGIDKKDCSSQMSSGDRLMVSSSSATDKFWESTSLPIWFPRTRGKVTYRNVSFSSIRITDVGI